MKNARRILFVMLAAIALVLPKASSAAIAVSITIAPPLLPVYAQPACPAPGYIWTPGYWAWSPEGYYWVPGTWVQPPTVGLLWTPGYWAWNGGGYIWNEGYWGPTIGFYGGVVYGFGYDGVGFQGGYWQGNEFYYNRSVTNVNVTVVRNVYERPVRVSSSTAVSYNGGPRGLGARPTREQEAAMRERHVAPTGLQREHERSAEAIPELRADFNHGRPAIAATERPGAFKEGGAARPMGKPERAPNEGMKGNGRATAPNEARPGDAPRPWPKPEHQPPSKPEYRPAPKPEHQPPSRPEYRPAPKPEHQPSQKPEYRPAPSQERHPAQGQEHKQPPGNARPQPGPGKEQPKNNEPHG